MDEMTLEDALKVAVKVVNQSDAIPENMYHPDYGWIRRDGEWDVRALDFVLDIIG